VRKKPLSMVQLDMFGEFYNERVLYVRSQKKGKASFPRSFSEDVQSGWTMGPSDECSY